MAGIADELEKLGALYQGGSLTDAEYAAAKAAVLDGVSAAAPPLRAVPVSRVEDPKLQADLDRLDKAWEIERKEYLVGRSLGAGYVARPWMGILIIVITLYYGLSWLVGSMAMGAVTSEFDRMSGFGSRMDPMWGSGATMTGPNGEEIQLGSIETPSSPMGAFSGGLVILSLVLLILGLTIGAYHLRQGGRYQDAEREYVRKRADLLAGAGRVSLPIGG